MKRLVIIAILFFPVLTLAVWCFWGYGQPRPNHVPPAARTNHLNPDVTNWPAK